jgi:hypothetical protein
MNTSRRHGTKATEESVRSIIRAKIRAGPDRPRNRRGQEPAAPPRVRLRNRPQRNGRTDLPCTVGRSPKRDRRGRTSCTARDYHLPSRLCATRLGRHRYLSRSSNAASMGVLTLPVFWAIVAVHEPARG